MLIQRLSGGGWLLLAVLLALPLFSVLPALDLDASGLFYDHAIHGFWLKKAMLPNLIHDACQIGARIAGGLLIICVAYNLIARRRLFGLDSKAALFMLAVLIVGPGLVTNTVFKDFWGRARPYQIQEFDGPAIYTPPLIYTNQCDHNCSFISGDGALGFSLHTLFYTVPPARRRRTFWLGWLGGGLLFGGNRVIMGSHFLSDVVYSGMFMLLVSALLYALFYGWATLREHWRYVLYKPA